MNYKNITLAALLVPFSGYSTEKDVRINELKEAQYQKALELKSHMDKIRSLWGSYLVCEDYDTFLAVACTQSDNKKLSQKEKESEERQKGLALERLLRQGLDCVSGVEEEMEQKLLNPGAHFAPLHALHLEGAVMTFLLEILEEKFQVCLRELLAINKELKTLQF